MPKKLTVEEVLVAGVTTDHEQMDNGELRFRLTGRGGTGYIRLEAGAKGAWGNSHHHLHTREVVVVEKGWIAIASLESGKTLRIAVYRRGDTFKLEPAPSHNAYIAGDSVIHVVKYESSSLGKDWFANPRLDAMTKHLREEEILRLAK